jgi:sugar/nucleoside kinase (ribokinase family)
MKYDICAIGNALVDTQFKVSQEFIEENNLELDQMSLCERDEQNKIIQDLANHKYESVVDCGGSATNSLVAAANFGSKCFHICKVSNDSDGRLYIENLKKSGVSHQGLKLSKITESTGKCLILVTPDAKRTMLSTLGSSACLSIEDVNYHALANSKIFFIEGYMTTSNQNFSVLLEIMNSKRLNNIKKAITLSDAGVVKTFKNRFVQIEKFGLDYMFCNDAEALAYSSSTTIDDSISFFKEKEYTTIITMGEKGCAIIRKGCAHFSPALKIDAVDTNGAGDMFAGTYLHCINNGFSHKKAAALSNYASSMIVQKFGPRLTKNEYTKILKKIKKS